MSWIADNWLRLSMLSAYLALLVWHAWEGRRRTKDLSDFLIAGRSLGGWVVGLSFYATFMSTNTFIGQSGKSWDAGLIWCVNGVVLFALCCVSWFVVAPRFVRQTREMGSLTVADYLGYRYDSRGLRRMSAVVVFVGSVIYLVAVYKGSSLALAQFLGLSYQLSAGLIFVVVTLYTLTGGFRSVALTDAVQGTLMVVGAVALLVAILQAGGGLAPLLDKVRARDPALVSWQGNVRLDAMLGIALASGLKFLVEPRQLSRFYGLKDDPALRLARVVSPLLIGVTYLCLLPIGALAHGVIPAGEISDSDRVIPYLLGVSQLFGPLLSTLFLLVLLSAAMSSLDSVLLVAASSMDHDLVAPDSQSGAVRRTRVWVVVVSIISMLLALNPFADIVDITSLSGTLYGACFLPALVVGLYWKRGTRAAALASVAIGGATTLLWFGLRKGVGVTSLHEVYIGVSVGMIVYLGVSWMSPNADRPC